MATPTPFNEYEKSIIVKFGDNPEPKADKVVAVMPTINSLLCSYLMLRAPNRRAEAIAAM